MTVTMLRHNKVDLALHTLRAGSGRAGSGRPGDGTPLLLLHGLGEASPTQAPQWAANWVGPVVALDFTGHGQSTVPPGGGYTAEIVLADADIALAELGTATLVGRGLGAYVALMLAGARPQQIHGAVLCDGPGLAGGAIGPTSQSFVTLAPSPHPPDPYALFELSRDLRPPDYATLFVRMAVESSGLDEPISVAAIVRPPWLAAVVDEIGVTTCSVTDALATYAQTTA
jgi:pimeloyl-ACP methyl ester carboxylesterase